MYGTRVRDQETSCQRKGQKVLRGKSTWTYIRCSSLCQLGLPSPLIFRPAQPPKQSKQKWGCDGKRMYCNCCFLGPRVWNVGCCPQSFVLLSGGVTGFIFVYMAGKKSGTDNWYYLLRRSKLFSETFEQAKDTSKKKKSESPFITIIPDYWQEIEIYGHSRVLNFG